MKRLTSILAAIMLGAGAANAQMQDGPAGGMMSPSHGPHILRHQSSAGFDATLAQLQAAVETRGFKTFAVIDHAAGAASIGQTLRPATLVIFGNPKGGTPAMQAEQLMALELPLKMLAIEDENGGATLVWRDMAHTFHEYGVEDHPAAEKMSAVLKAIAEEAGR
ncbi:DUF302 domain-containing protein [Hyphococcus luteus]|uniref:DUF302 domain-containing protein n=1 Tax=Hyphococcus luteus TaxID=2058213 RepID=A0A2S7K6P3_9PROT|nr:DUF302 domain-containing protein [Marinicaulis flavus]PQA88173.1 hypothetical protein CW354_07625 [Marinicaulis flavus]